MASTVNQRNWLVKNKSNKKLVKKFLCSLPLVVEQTINLKTEEQGFAPTSAGVILDTSYKTREEAEQSGKKILNKFWEETIDLPEIDVRGEHIDGGVLKYIPALEDVDLRVESITCIAFLASSSTDIGSLVEPLVDHLSDGAQHSSVQGLTAEMEDCSEEDFVDLATSLGYYGFFLIVSTPLIKNDGSSSWGCYTTTVVYGDDLDEAIAHAMQWAKDYYDTATATTPI
jgi:hypothetical protein